MTTAPGHSGVTTVGPEKSHRWLLMLALVAITAVGIAAVTMIINQADTGVSTTPAVVAPVEVAPAPVEVPAAAALIAPVLEAPLSLQELALMNEAATGLVPAGVLAQEMALGVEKALESTALSVQELALMNEAATGLVPTGILADEMAIGHEFGYEATALSGLEYALMNEVVTGLVPTGVLADEMALGIGFDYSATIGNTSMSPIVSALIGAADRSYISLEEYEFISEILRGLVPTGVLEDEMTTP